MTTCVIGLGKIGLPLAVQIAGKDEQVIGVDINEDVVSLVNQGEVPFPGERNLREFLAKVKEEGSLLATSNTAEAVSQSETVIVVVPVIVDANANPNFLALTPPRWICQKEYDQEPLSATKRRFR